MAADKISLDNAKPDKLVYFIANVVIVRESDGRCLILKRSDREKAHPGKYCVPGGKLEWGMFDINNPTRMNGEVKDYENAVEKLLTKETLEEANIEIEGPLQYINSVFYVRPDQIPVILVKFAARYKSGEVKLEEGGFTDFVWVNDEEVLRYDCIEGIKEEVAASITLYKKD
jgi:8-oxo-dGTP pyrophosphatase MutT (NUDIX family)